MLKTLRQSLMRCSALSVIDDRPTSSFIHSFIYSDEKNQKVWLEIKTDFFSGEISAPISFWLRLKEAEKMWKLVEDAKDVDQELLKLFPAKYFNLPQLGS